LPVMAQKIERMYNTGKRSAHIYSNGSTVYDTEDAHYSRLELTTTFPI